MKNNRMKGALENIARRDVPENINLWTRIAADIDERKSFMRTLRKRPLMIVIIIVFALLLLTGVVYAVGKVMGYIPGIGIVDQSVPLRVLAEPIIMERNGVKLTVNQVVLSAEATNISYQVNDVGLGEYDHEGTLRVQLSNGTILDGWYGGGGVSSNTYYKTIIIFPPVPQDVNDVILLFDYKQESWKIPLHFVLAPLNMPIAQVIELTPVSGAPQNALVLEKVVETEDSYILFGRFNSVGFPEGITAGGEWGQTIITDANGKKISYGNPDGASLLTGNGESGNFPWVYEIKGKEHDWPLTITFNIVRAEVVDGASAEFDFDTGPNPQPDQKWIIDKDVSIAGLVLHIVSISHTGYGYRLRFADDPGILSIGMEIVNAENSGSVCQGGGFVEGRIVGNGENESDKIPSRINCDGEVPSGKMTIRITVGMIVLKGPWQLQWQPDAIP